MPETSKEIRDNVNKKITEAKQSVVRQQEEPRRKESEISHTEAPEKNKSHPEGKTTTVSHKEWSDADFHTIDESRIHQEDLDAQKAENDKKIAKGNRDSTYHDGFEKNKGPIFEQADIIDYMFKQLLKGADWLVNKGLDGAGWAGYALGDYIGSGISDWKDALKNKKELKDKDTVKFMHELQQLHKSHLAQQQQEVGQCRNFIKALAAEFQNGNIDLVKKKPELYQALSQTPPETLKKLFTPENAEKLADNVITQARLREQFISNYAAARMLGEKAANAGAYKDTDVAANFKLKRLEAMDVYNKIFRHAEKEQNPKLLNDALILSQQALKQEVEGIGNGLFKENKDNPIANNHMKAIEDMAAKSNGLPAQPLNLNNPAHFVNYFTGFDKTEIDALNARLDEHRRRREDISRRTGNLNPERRPQPNPRTTPAPTRDGGR